jgi:hypothetical protein
MSFAIAEKGLEKIWRLETMNRHRRHGSGIKKDKGCVGIVRLPKCHSRLLYTVDKSAYRGKAKASTKYLHSSQEEPNHSKTGKSSPKKPKLTQEMNQKHPKKGEKKEFPISTPSPVLLSLS